MNIFVCFYHPVRNPCDELGPANFNLPGVHRGFGRSGAYAVEFGAVAKTGSARRRLGPDAGDGFITAKLQAANLSPQPEADQHTLIRRLTLGLTGLPPTVADGAVCVGYEARRLRASGRSVTGKPAFGERWGRHWLDVVRFGESSGELTVNDDKPRSNAWRFRDAVIRALNEDVPLINLSGSILCRKKKTRSWGSSFIWVRGCKIMRIRTINSFIG